MTLTDTNLRYLLAIYHLAKTMPEVTPLAVAQAMGVTKPSVTSILSCLMKHDVIVRKRYGKVYLTDRGVLYAATTTTAAKNFAALPAGGGFYHRRKGRCRPGHGRRPAAREVDARCAVIVR